MLLQYLFGLETRHTGGMVVTGAGLDQDATLKKIFGRRGTTAAGVQVDSDTPLTVSAWYAAIRLLAWTTAYLPLFIYERLPNDEREARKDHPLHKLLHARPNPDMSSMTYRSIGMMDIILQGDAMSYIERNQSGHVAALWPLDPSQVRVGRFENRRLAYDIRSIPDPPTSKPILTDREVVHVPGLGWNGLRGRSVVTFAREHLGEAIAAQTFGAASYGAGPRIDLVITRPTPLRNKKTFRDRFRKTHSNPVPTIPILDEGMKLEGVPRSIPLKDVLYIESRQFLVTDAARWLGVPPHKIADLIRATFSNIAEQNVEWRQSLIPWLTLFEQEYNWKLFTESEQERLFIEHVTEGLLQGDPASQDKALAIAVQNGWLNRNQVARIKNLPNTGPDGEIYTVQSNLQPVSALNQPEPEPEEPGEEEPGEEEPAGGDPEQMGGQQEYPVEVDEPTGDQSRSLVDPVVDDRLARAWWEESIRTVLRRETAELRVAAKKAEGFLGRLDGVYARLPDKVDIILASVRHATRRHGGTLTNEHFRASKGLMLELSGSVKTSADLAAAVDKEARRWVEVLPSQMADTIMRSEGIE